VNIDQLNIRFADETDFNNFWRSLAEKIDPITKGIPLKDWVEKIGNNLYTKSGQTHQCIELERYYSTTRVSKCIYNKELMVNARLIANTKDFIIELKDYGVHNDKRLQRYFIAHEIAHTFFYNTEHESIRDYKLFMFGSKEIEFLCNRIARAILMPMIVLVNKLSKFPNVNDHLFSLESIVQLCDAFKVPHTVFLNRVISDTGLWNCLLVRFMLYENEQNRWKLRERYVPSYHWRNTKAFIPQEDVHKDNDNPNRFPSAKGSLAKSFDEVYTQLLITPRISKEFDTAAISESPLKHFIQFYFPNSQKIVIHFSLGKHKHTKYHYLNVCVPLPVQ